MVRLFHILTIKNKFMKTKIKILGLGQTSMICAIMLCKRGFDVEIFDEKPLDQFKQSHFALLRFKTDKIEQETGIKLSKFKTEKAIYIGKHFDKVIVNESNIELNNKYSFKVSGKYQSRSIGNLNSGIRYQPPENFFELLLNKCVELGVKFKKESINASINAIINKFDNFNVISTIPMPKINEIIFKKDINFDFQKIYTAEFELTENVFDVNQTIYFPEEHHLPYRISITNNKIKCEMSKKQYENKKNKHSEIEIIDDLMNIFCDAFGVNFDFIRTCFLNFDFKNVIKEQKFGKISPIDEHTRQTIIYQLTKKYNIYSLGRFSCWRNILLDDVVDDVKVIEKLISLKNFSESYESSKSIVKNF